MEPSESCPTRPSNNHSPNVSVDSHSTPLLHNLTQRLRKSSSASGSSNSSDPPPDPTAKTEASRDARRMIRERVRVDWQYPDPPSADASRAPVGYRAREESQSDLEAEELFAKRRTKRETDPYKFENPDSVGNWMDDRKQKRRKLFADELAWNEGLRIWTAQRDAWTGAVQQKPAGKAFVEPTKASARSRFRRSIQYDRKSNVSTTDSTTATSPPTSPTSPVSPTTTIPLTESSPTSSDSSVLSTSHPIAEPRPYLPVYPPLLPADDALRVRINPRAYSTIYSKIVIQSLCPNVPIPLSHMIPALVEGWKAEGQWPPQPASLLPADIKKGRSSKFSQWRAETRGPVVVTEDGKSRVRRGIGVVKRALGRDGGGLDDLGIEFHEQDREDLEKDVALNQRLLTGGNGKEQ